MVPKTYAKQLAKRRENMSVKDLPLTTVAGYTGNIDGFIQVNEARTQVVINPGRAQTKTIENAMTAQNYLRRVASIPFDYKLLKTGQHLVLDVKANIGFEPYAGVRHIGAGEYEKLAANGISLVPTGVKLYDSRKRASKTAHNIIDTMLEHTVVVDMDSLDPTTNDKAREGIKTLIENLAEMLGQPDVLSALKFRQEIIDASQEADQEARGALNGSNDAGFQRPATLDAVVDGIMANVYQLPTGIKLYRQNQDGSVAKISWIWDSSNPAVKWVLNQVGKGFNLVTEAYAKAESLL
jgi:hypothetical protein